MNCELYILNYVLPYLVTYIKLRRRISQLSSKVWRFVVIYHSHTQNSYKRVYCGLSVDCVYFCRQRYWELVGCNFITMCRRETV